MTALEVHPLALPGLVLIQPAVSGDDRGQFVKTFHAAALAEQGLQFELREEFYTISHRNVLRGMHFQLPPHDHQKLVSCMHGRVLDVLLDLRTASPAYGQHLSLELNGDTPQMVWIPRGVAHGFLSLDDNTCMLYKTDREHAPEHDAGIRWNSFGADWRRSDEQLIVSPRDRKHPPLAEFNSPF